MRVKGYNGWVGFDGEVVTIAKRMRGSTQIPASAITSMAILPAGLGMKGIRFTVAGGSATMSPRPIGSHKDLAMDPYALTFRSKRAGEFEDLIRQVNAARG